MLAENRDLPAENPARQFMQRKFVIENDVTVPPWGKVTGLVDFKSYPEYTRWVHVTGGPICTFAYALSQGGARKVLFDLSVDHLTGAFDNALAGLCRRSVSSLAAALANPGMPEDRRLDTRCISVTPPVFFHHRAKGSVSSDSDIQKIGDGGIREKGSTENIMWSARNNLRNMLMNWPMESQF